MELHHPVKFMRLPNSLEFLPHLGDWFLITQNRTAKLECRAHKGTIDQGYTTFRLELTDKLPVTGPPGMSTS